MSLTRRTTKWLVIGSGLFWTFAVLTTNIFGFQQTIGFFSNLFGVEFIKFAGNVDHTTIFTPYLKFIEPYYSSSYNVFFTLSIVSSALTIFILGQGRTLAEIIWLFIGFFLPAKRKDWGRVINQNYKPVGFASIRLVDKDNKIISETISDLDGRYRIYIPDSDAEYQLQIRANNFVELTKQIHRKDVRLNKDDIIEEIILVEKQSASQTLVEVYSRIKKFLSIYLQYYITIIALFGLSFAIYGLLAYPGLETYVYVTIYTAALVWNIRAIRQRQDRDYGRILSANGEPIGNLYVELYRDQKLIGAFTTNSGGITKFGVEAGKYRLQVAQQKFDAEIEVNSEGYLSKDLTIKQIADASSTVLPNPFQ